MLISCIPLIINAGLARSHAKAVQLEPVYIIKSGELNQLVQLVSKYSLEPSLGDPDQVMESMLGNMTEVVTLSNQLTACTTVIMHLEETLGGTLRRFPLVSRLDYQRRNSEDSNLTLSCFLVSR
jgi:hypothetical protein